MLMKNRIQHLILISLCSLLPALAQAHLELNAFYMSDAMNTGSAETHTKMFVELCVGFSIDKDSRYLLGWNYGVFNTADTTTTTTTYASNADGARDFSGSLIALKHGESVSPIIL